jgi:hypothetical protein
MTSSQKKRALALVSEGLALDDIAALLSIAPSEVAGIVEFSLVKSGCSWCGEPAGLRQGDHAICRIAKDSQQKTPVALIEAVEVRDPDRAAELFRQRAKGVRPFKRAS